MLNIMKNKFKKIFPDEEIDISEVKRIDDRIKYCVIENPNDFGKPYTEFGMKLGDGFHISIYFDYKNKNFVVVDDDLIHKGREHFESYNKTEILLLIEQFMLKKQQHFYIV
jgi:hypothetical protein